jgi:hypothetical protein
VKQPKSELGEGERVLERWRANRTQSAQRAVGGHLHLTDRRLLFEPHAFDASLAGRTVSVPLVDVSDVTRVPRDLRDLFGGGLRARLAVVTPRETHLFVVNDLDGKVERIQRERRRAQG